MFVVPLYAFLTTTVPKSETARTIAANNIVNSRRDGRGHLILTLSQLGVGRRRQPADRGDAAWSPPGSAGSFTWPAIEARLAGLAQARYIVMNRSRRQRSARTA